MAFRRVLLILLLAVSLVPSRADGMWGWLEACFKAAGAVAGQIGALRESQRQASWKAANEKSLAKKKRVLPLRTPEKLAVASTDFLGDAAARYGQGLSRNMNGFGGLGDTLLEQEQLSWLRLPSDLRALAAKHVYETSEPVTLVHGSETAIREFDVDFNLNPLNSVESVTAGPGVYTFRKVGDAFPGDLTDRAPKHVFQFEIPAGATVLDLNDPAVNSMVNKVMKLQDEHYSRRIQSIRQNIYGTRQHLGLSEEDIKRSYAIHDLWFTVGKPDLIIGMPYNESEVVVRNPAFLKGYTTPVVEYPDRQNSIRPRSLPVDTQSSSTTP